MPDRSLRQARPDRYVDFDRLENSEFLFTRQYRVVAPRCEIVADIVIFVNGIPLFAI